MAWKPLWGKGNICQSAGSGLAGASVLLGRQAFVLSVMDLGTLVQPILNNDVLSDSCNHPSVAMAQRTKSLSNGS